MFFIDYEKKLEEIASEHKKYCEFTHGLSIIEGLSLEMIRGAFQGEYKIVSGSEDENEEEMKE